MGRREHHAAPVARRALAPRATSRFVLRALLLLASWLSFVDHSRAQLPAAPSYAPAPTAPQQPAYVAAVPRSAAPPVLTPPPLPIPPQPAAVPSPPLPPPAARPAPSMPPANRSQVGYPEQMFFAPALGGQPIATYEPRLLQLPELPRSPRYDGATDVLPKSLVRTDYAETIGGPELVPPGFAEPEFSPDGCVLPEPPHRRGWGARLYAPPIAATKDTLSSVRFDYINFYSPRSLLWLGGGIGVAAALANTSADQHFRDWYQDDVRSPASDRFRNDIAWLGNGGIMVPVWIASSLALTPIEEYSPAAHAVGTWGRKSTRAFLVGGPMLLALQYGLGAHRPSAHLDSHWHPFRDSHGASGDAWVGAITFLTAAKMSDSVVAKAAFWTLALFPAWGRINVDQHYLSQVTLGVWLAALSVEAVDVTDRHTCVSIVPTAGPGTVGSSLLIRW